MDEIDIKILELLENNGRMSHEEIGKRLNMSRPAIHQRVSKLEQNKIIKNYNTEINWSKVGQGIGAIVFINVRTSDFKEIMEQVINLKIEGLTIEKCYRITGQWCIMLKIRAGLTEQVTLLHDELLKIEGMSDTFTMLILSEANKNQQL
ncbi:AsnC family transcriptional regulator [Alkaliphilus sp. MSJ-5]|uniref:AsnC family transcriptional regulator n=1 Tax=Alkaliphilus flagellatus TaxID=2841507 RepID=A0ABS6FYV2_9FIRM|nr:AsnC family transcriptional regulator [Alkaliphilus flagellatus]MBU5675414.1 AsnC family transcriptional regulator [Alkaliphilus flagellatus]